MKFEITYGKGFIVLVIDLEGEVIEPPQLNDIVHKVNEELKDIPKNQGIVLYGRAPIWLYSTLVHEFHHWLWIAVFDPRIDGAVVVASHLKGLQIGEVIPL